MHIDPIGLTPDGPGISAVLADAENADDLGTSIRFVSNKASLSSVANTIVEHRRDLDEVTPARFRMDLFRSTTVGQNAEALTGSKSFVTAADGSGRRTTCKYNGALSGGH